MILSLLLMTTRTFVLIAETADKSITISDIRTEIDGNTKEDSLLKEMGLYIGRDFESYEDLVNFMDVAVQNLINMRVFELIEYSLEKEEASDAADEYTVYLNIRDSFTLYPIPYPKYNSNTGWRIGFKTYYYNAFGRLVDILLFTNMDIQNNEAKGHWEIPSWHITPAIEGIDLWGQDFRIELSHKFGTFKKIGDFGNEENILLQEYTLHNTSLSMGTKIFLPLDFYYRADPRLGFYYGLKELQTDASRGGAAVPYFEDPAITPVYDVLDFSWDHAIGYDTIDWIGNFRQGFSASIGNILSLSSDLNEENPVNFTSEINAQAKYFWRISKHFNFSTMAEGIISFRKEMTSLGSHLRGVRDDLMFGDKALFWSVDMNISVLDWEGKAEAQVRPFFNLGYVRNDFNTGLTDEDRNMFAYGAGADFVLYLDKLKALQARGTIAVDLSQYNWDDGDKYEIEVTTSLSY
ncbi:MAG: hypothetical protein JXR86_03620 [Spirochaetales bacterium]|nr:hypothetical protein [Spirochaetales bacterium]